MKKILVIEDDTVLANTIKNYLSLKSLEVIHANNGAVGIQYAFSILPDAIICDINIPVVDGYQVYKILSESLTTQSIPFIFLTAKSSNSDVREGMSLGVDDYITKPFEFYDLHNAISTRITKREKILGANEDKFYSLLNNSPHGVFVCQKNKFIVVNRNFANLFGYSQMEVIDKCLVELTDIDDKQKIDTVMTDCLSNRKKEFKVEFSGRSSFGKKIALKLIAGYSFYKGQDCIIGSLINLSSDEYSMKDINLSSSDLEELGNAIEMFSADYNIISKDLVEKLANIFIKEKNEKRNSTIELSIREREVLSHICLGESTSEIADSLFISNRTVEKHRAAIVQKTGSKNMIEAVIIAINNKLIKI